jgi:hypothetical protein
MNLNELNKTELLELCRLHGHARLKEGLTKDRLIEIINNGTTSADDLANTNITRKRLQQFIQDNWELVNTNLPCKGKLNAGKCTIFPCSEARHVSCYLGAKRYLGN